MSILNIDDESEMDLLSESGSLENFHTPENDLGEFQNFMSNENIYF